MTTRITSLEDTLRALPVTTPLPLSLPLAHVSIARWFDSIVSNGNLEPRTCSVFGENLVYLFYGGVFYRPSNKPTRNAAELPVAFLFNPSLLAGILRLYPFDTGGVASGRFGRWGSLLSASDVKFRVPGDGRHDIASKLVYHIFGTNEQYLDGEPDPRCAALPDPIPELFAFYSDDLTPSGVDQRQCLIECQSGTPVPLDRELLWVGFPEAMTEEFARLCAWMDPYVPQFHAYQSHKIKTPSEITAQLEAIAYRDVVQRFVRLPK